jgi:hypothetical protein
MQHDSRNVAQAVLTCKRQLWRIPNYRFASFSSFWLFHFMAVPQRSVDWQPLRDAFVQRSPRPSYSELSAEFNVPITTISICASEEAWTSLRAQFLETRLREADASAVLLEAIKIDRTLIRTVSDLALVALNRLKHEIERLTDEKAPSTNVEVLNTCSFAAANFTRALKDTGVIGLPKGMSAEGKELNGRWNPEMLQQINVTVQNLTAQTKGETVVPAQVTQSDTPGGSA